jgi:hypothetical protein
LPAQHNTTQNKSPLLCCVAVFCVAPIDKLSGVAEKSVLVSGTSERT